MRSVFFRYQFPMRVAGLLLLAVAAPLPAAALDPDQLTGTPFCAPWDGGNPALAFDGDLNTWFYSSAMSGGYVGIDLGTARRISKVMIWMGGESRIIAGWIHGSNTGPDTDMVVLAEPQAPFGRSYEWFTVPITDPTPYRWINFYARYSSHCQVSEIKVFGPETVGPTVLSTFPANVATDVRQLPVRVTFSKPMNRPSAEGAFTIDPPVTGSFVWEQDPMTAADSMLFKATYLKSYTTYTVTVGGQACDAWDNPLGTPRTFTFTTGDLVPPRVTAMSPKPGSVLTSRPSAITLTFSKALDPSTIDAWTFDFVRSNGDGLFGGKESGAGLVYYPSSLTMPAPNQVTFSIRAGDLFPTDVYLFRIYAFIRDMNGNYLDGDFSVMNGPFGGTFPSGDGNPGGDFFGYFAIGDPGNGNTTRLYQASVTAGTLNVRLKPGTAAPILGTVARDRIVNVYESSNGWSRIGYGGGYAWVLGQYLAKVPPVLFWAKVTATSLSVRTGPGTTYAKVGTLAGGTVVRVYATSGSWYKIIYGGYYRWINGTYTQKV